MKEAGSLLSRATTAASGSVSAAGDVTGATAQAQSFTNGIASDTVSELTATAGVTLDGVLLKDARVVLSETSTPSAPAADKAILYLDGGGVGGKSRLLILFQSGSAVEVALEV